MKRIYKIFNISAILIASLGFAGAFSFNQEIISLQTLKYNQKLKILFMLKEGYGVQKDGPHKLKLILLKQGHESEPNFDKKIKIYATKSFNILSKNNSFSGVTAKEDAEYFSRLNSVVFRDEAIKKSESYALTGSIYYCSFADKFCSVQKIKKIIP